MSYFADEIWSQSLCSSDYELERGIKVLPKLRQTQL